LVESPLEGVVVMVQTGIVFEANAAALAMHGVAKVEELGENAEQYVQRSPT
jgi:hypothetical protein